MEKKKGKKKEMKAEKKKWIRNIFIGMAAVLLFRYFRNDRREGEDEESD